MKALVLEGINEVKYTEVDTPVANDGEVLVKVMAAGICGSDIPRTYRDGAHVMPLILGHEFSGQVYSVGNKVSDKWIGKRVGIFPLIPCRECEQCRANRYELCGNYSYLGSRRNGAFAEYVTVPEWNLVELPENVSYEDAAMLEPMAVAVHAMRRVSVNKEDTVLVCGAGTIGCLLVMFLLEKNVENVYVACNKDFQKQKLVELGIMEDHICDIRVNSVNEFISDRTQGRGVSVYFDCVGSNEVIATALNVTSPMGRVCYVGNPHTDISMDKNTYWQILRKQLTITGTWNSSYIGSNNMAIDSTVANDDIEDDWQYVIRRLGAKRINLTGLITHRFSLENLIEGFEIMRDKSEDYIKIITVAE